MKAYSSLGQTFRGFCAIVISFGASGPLLSAPGDLDPTFQTRGLPMDPAWPAIQTLVIQQNDRIVLGGSFLEWDGRPARGLARLLPNGGLDTSYSPNLNLRSPAAGLRVRSMLLLPGDRVVFDAAGLMDINGISPRGSKDSAPARLFADGSLDEGFVPGAHQSTGLPLPTEVRVLAAYASGEILVQADGLRRLDSHGAIDENWPRANGDAVIAGYFLCAGTQRSGAALVYGQFNVTAARDPLQDRLYRLRPEGAVDPTFTPWEPIVPAGTYGSGQQPVIRQLLVLPDDKILVIGTFSWLRQGNKTFPRGSVARLNADGSIDESFGSAQGLTDVYTYPEIPQWNATNSRAAFTAAVAPDGKVLVGGSFRGYDGVARPNLVRLNTDGTLDSTFRPPVADRWITQVGVQSDGKVIISSATVAGAAGLPPYRGGAGLVRLDGGPLEPGVPRIVENPVTQSVILSSAEPVTVQFSVRVASPMPPSFQWMYNGSPLADGPGVSGARTSTLVLSVVSQTRAGRYECEIANAGGRVTTEPALLYVNHSASPVPDAISPRLTVISPEPANFRTADPKITIYGSASDNVGLAQVWMAKDDGPPQLVRGLSQWQVVSDLNPGTNRFQFRAVDLAGNFSAAMTHTVVFVVMKGFALTIHGQGNVSRPTFGASLEAGQFYTLQAAPKPGNLFSNWFVNGVSYGNPTFRFLLTSDMEIVANFVPNPFPALAGTYTTLFYDPAAPDHSSAGSLNFNLTSKGSVAGKGMFAGKPLTVGGQLGLHLQANCDWILQDGSPVRLRLQLAEGSDALTGSVLLPTRIVPLTGYRVRAPVARRTNGTPVRFTLVLARPDPGVPDSAGPGYATMLIDRNGKLRLNGWLGDGTPWSSSAALSAEGRFPLYLPLSGGAGSLFGWITLAPTETNDLQGILTWSRPGFYKNNLRLVGSQYHSPPAGEAWLDSDQAVLIREGGNLTAPVTNSVILKEDLQLVMAGPSPEDVTLVFKPASGLIVGRFAEPSGQTTQMKGVILRKQGVGSGLFQGTNRPGSFFLGPSERYPIVR